MFVVKTDGNNRIVEGGVEELVPVRFSTRAGNHEIEVPKRAYAFMVKRLPVDAELSVNEAGFFPVDEADQYGTFLELEKLNLYIKEDSDEETVIVFLR